MRNRNSLFLINRKYTDHTEPVVITTKREKYTKVPINEPQKKRVHKLAFRDEHGLQLRIWVTRLRS